MVVDCFCFLFGLCVVVKLCVWLGVRDSGKGNGRKIEWAGGVCFVTGAGDPWLLGKVNKRNASRRMVLISSSAPQTYVPSRRTSRFLTS